VTCTTLWVDRNARALVEVVFAAAGAGFPEEAPFPVFLEEDLVVGTRIVLFH